MLRARRKLQARGPLDRGQARALLFSEKMSAAVWRWLRRLKVPLPDRGDVAQEVFLQAHRSFESYDPMRSRPERWLNKITVHTASHYGERAHRRREVLTAQGFFDLVDDRPTPDEQIAAEEDRLERLDAFQEVEPELRSVLIAHDIDGIPMAEIAAQRGLPVSTAYKWHTRARSAFKEALERRRREEEVRIAEGSDRGEQTTGGGRRHPPGGG